MADPEEPTEVGWYAYSGGAQNVIFHLRDGGQWSAHFADGTAADCSWGYIEQCLSVWDLVRIDFPGGTDGSPEQHLPSDWDRRHRVVPPITGPLPGVTYRCVRCDREAVGAYPSGECEESTEPGTPLLPERDEWRTEWAVEVTWRDWKKAGAKGPTSLYAQFDTPEQRDQFLAIQRRDRDVAATRVLTRLAAYTPWEGPESPEATSDEEREALLASLYTEITGHVAPSGGESAGG
jgi:hypothetical protein